MFAQRSTIETLLRLQHVVQRYHAQIYVDAFDRWCTEHRGTAASMSILYLIHSDESSIQHISDSGNFIDPTKILLEIFMNETKIGCGSIARLYGRDVDKDAGIAYVVTFFFAKLPFSWVS